MAVNKFTYQQQNNVSINRNMLISLAAEDLSKKEYKVLIMLFSVLNGYSPSVDRYGNIDRKKDPKNFTRIDKSSIADSIGLSVSKVEDCIERFLDLGLLEEGENDTVRKGYRFTF